MVIDDPTTSPTPTGRCAPQSAPLPTGTQDIDAGVIKDARARQRRHRDAGVLIAAAAIGGVMLVFSGGGSGSGTGHGSGHGLGGQSTPVAASAPDSALLSRAVADCRFPLGIMTLRQGGRVFASRRLIRRGLVLDATASNHVGLISVLHGNVGMCVVRIDAPPQPDLPMAEDQRRGSSPSKLPPNRLWSGDMSGTGYQSTTSEGFYAFGRAGRKVSGVEYLLPNHRTVRAQLEHGWYIAWWPKTARGTNRPDAVQVTTSSGAMTSPLPGRQCANNSESCVFVSHRRFVGHRA